MCNEIRELPISRVVILSEGEQFQETDLEYPFVYKYQSSDQLISEVMEYYAGTNPSTCLLTTTVKTKLIGVYSPVGRSGKTSFALALGEILAETKQVLYLNLEEFSGLSVLMKEEYKSDLSDLLYFYNGGSYNSLRLSSVVHTMGELDYIPPVRYPEDLDQAGEEAIAGLIRAIAGESAYDTLVVDIGSGRRTALSVMKLCRVIYMPIREDPVSLAKLKELEQYFSQTGNGMLRERIKRLKLPYHGSFGRGDYIDQLLWGELGDYVRQLLRGSSVGG